MMIKPGQDHDPVAQLACDLKVLSVETRLRILVILRERTLCVGALASTLRLTQGAVSQHLKVLRESGLLRAHRDGHFMHYRVNEDALDAWRDQIDALFAPLTARDEAHPRTNMQRAPGSCSVRTDLPCRRKPLGEPS